MEIERANNKSNSSEAEVKKDRTFKKYILIWGLVTFVAVLAALAKYGVAGVLVVIALAVAAQFLMTAWALSFFKCPTCKKRIEAESPGKILNRALRFHCPDCGVVWDTGVVLGGTED